MVDINLLRENPEKFRKATSDKQLDPKLVDDVLKLDEKRRKLIQETETLRAERNEISSKQKVVSSKGKEIKIKLKELEPELREVEEGFRIAILQIPNPALGDVIVGTNETENEIIRTWGERKEFKFNPKDHLELGETLDIIDVKRAAKVSGARFSYLKGDGVLLELALVNLAMETLMSEGFIPVIPPALIKKESM